jgi:hypothetical protein
VRSRRLALTVIVALVLAVATAAPAAATTVKFRITLSPAPMSFGSVPVGQMSAAQVLYATNRSAMPLRWVRSVFQARPASGTISLDVAPLPGGCLDGTEAIIEPGETCGLVAVAYMPAATGTFYIDGVSTFTDGVTTFTVASVAKGKGV